MKKFKRLRLIGSIIVVALAFSFFSFGVNAESEDIIDKVLGDLGTSQAGFYPWCINQITDCFKLMDTELAKVGVEQNFAGLWKDCINDTMTRFEGVDEENALDKLQELIDEVTQ